MLRGLEANAAASLVGQVLRGRYRLLKLLGAGGMGAVFRAEHIHLETIRAVKVMLSHHGDDPNLIKRFLREARGLSRLDHPNVVSVVDTGETEHGLPFIAMEFLEGEALSTTLNRDGPLPWSVVKHIARQVCAALHAAHELGIIHRDVKPDNCFRVYDNDDGYRIKLLDFGIARFQNDQVSQLTETGSLIGTLPYMSYEQICGEVCDRQSDVWSTAVMFYQLLTGVLPFRGKNVGQLSYAIVQHHPTPVSEVRPDLELPPPLDVVISQAMAKEKADRFQTMLEFLDALEAVPDPLGYVKTAPFKDPSITTANTEPALPAEPHQDEPEPASPADTPQTLPWYGAAVSNHQDDIAALARGELTFDSKSVNQPDVEPTPPLPPIIRRDGPSPALIALTLLVAVLAAWAVVQNLGDTNDQPTGTEKTVAAKTPQDSSSTAPDPNESPTDQRGEPEKIVYASNGATSPVPSEKQVDELNESDTANQTTGDVDPTSDTENNTPPSVATPTPSDEPAPREPSKQIKKKAVTTKKVTSEKKPRPTTTKTKDPPPAPEISCASLQKSSSIQKCIASCSDCTPPVKVRKKKTNVVILGTNKSAESINGKSLTACIDKAVGAMEGPLVLDGVCALN